MRKYVIAMVAALPLLATAQSKPFGELIKKYDRIKEVETAEVGGFKLGLARLASDDVPKELKSIKAISIEDKEKVSSETVRTLQSEIEAIITKHNYTLQLEKEKEKNKVSVYGQKVSDKIKDIIIYVRGDKAVSVMEFAGEFDSADKFIRQMVEGEKKDEKQ